MHILIYYFGFLALAFFTFYTPVHADTRFDLRPGKKLVFKTSIFEQGGATVSQREQHQFDNLLAYLKARPNLIIEISGYADNVGNPEANLSLSQARADGVKSYLVKQGIASERIKTRGFGSESPIATNDTEEGRAQNRRIEVVALSSRTERPTTIGRNTPLQSEGRITAILPHVLSLAPWDETWQEAHLGAEIYEYHRLRTVDKARAEITFQNKQRVQVAENSVVMIFGERAIPDNGNQSKPTEQMRVVQGSVLVKMKSLQKTQPMLVRTANGEVSVALGESTAKIEVDTKNQSLVSVHDGNANVQNASGEAMSVPKDYGTRVGKESPPEKPRPLPIIPDLIAPNLGDSLFAGIMLFQWKLHSPRVRFEVSSDITFQKPYHAVIFAQDSISLPIQAGEWYVRLSGIDEIGLESRSNIYRINVHTPSAPFRFYILTMLFFAATIGTSWWAWITRQKRLYVVAVFAAILAFVSYFFLHL